MCGFDKSRDNDGYHNKCNRQKNITNVHDNMMQYTDDNTNTEITGTVKTKIV